MRGSCSECVYLHTHYTPRGREYQCDFTGNRTEPDWCCFKCAKARIEGVPRSNWWKVGLYYVFLFFAVAWLSFVGTVFVLSFF